MNIRVSVSGPVMGDITIERNPPDQSSLGAGADRDAEEAAQMLEQIAADLRRMFPDQSAEREQARIAARTELFGKTYGDPRR